MRGLDDAQANDNRVLTKIMGWADSGAYALTDDIILLQNVDFITPLVNDPFTFGAIAAANALSDIYTMRGKPITALNILSYPKDDIDDETINLILKGGLSKLKEAGAVLLGGHTTDNDELIFGLSVTGTVSSEKVLLNSHSQEGDSLVLTKPIGSSLIAISYSREMGKVNTDEAELAFKLMSTLNKNASEVMQNYLINACTDITGFGFLGHLWEMCSTSNVRAIINCESVPYIAGSLGLVRQGAKSSARFRNKEFLNSVNAVHLDENVEDEKIELLYEGETSGGLLISLPSEYADEVVEKINIHQNNEFCRIIGHIEKGSKGISLRN